MDREGELDIIRRAYAKQVLAAGNVASPRVEAAFAAVRREDFLGPGPWPIFRWFSGYVETPDDDPVYLYTDDLVGIVPERRINNGQPSLHAALIAGALPREGDHVVHVGAGLGYYTAILAALARTSGRVTAIELDPDLARRAQANFATWPHVRIIQGDGAAVPFDAADVIYVNAGATRPADAWLERLAEGGRLILPLTTDQGFGGPTSSDIRRRGAVFRVERQGGAFPTRWISSVAIFPCEGGRDAESERALAAALAKGGWDRVTQLYRTDAVAEELCWLRGAGWCLAYG
jgi:protein-L-isoaspartate(D-aspartate) O-methyltransferase